MTALAEAWAPGYHWPGARPFDNEPQALQLVGIEYAAEQMDLLRRAVKHRHSIWDPMFALAVAVLPDPMFPNVGVLPALTVDPNDMSLAPVLVPQVVEIDCSEWETFDEKAPNWRRFPSLIGRSITYDYMIGEQTIEGLDAYRLWNLWPIDQDDVQLVYEAGRLWQKEHWEPWLKWLEVRDNQDSLACDYEGTPVHMHDHEYDDQGYVRACADGDRWFEHYSLTEVVWDPDGSGDPYHAPFAPVRGLHELQPVWDQLLVSSRINSNAALLAYPEWEREEAARLERHYSPWLWSS